MGKVHQGYFDALGDPPLRDGKISAAATQLKEESAKRPQQQVANRRIGNWWHQLTDPADKRFTSVDSSSKIHEETSMYVQVEDYLLNLLQKNGQQQKMIYITGHSLGAALGTSKGKKNAGKEIISSSRSF
jgi:hypothetical protein